MHSSYDFLSLGMYSLIIYDDRGTNNFMVINTFDIIWFSSLGHNSYIITVYSTVDASIPLLYIRYASMLSKIAKIMYDFKNTWQVYHCHFRDIWPLKMDLSPPN